MKVKFDFHDAFSKPRSIHKMIKLNQIIKPYDYRHDQNLKGEKELDNQIDSFITSIFGQQTDE